MISSKLDISLIFIEEKYLDRYYYGFIKILTKKVGIFE